MDAANYLAIALDYTVTDLRVETACREAALSEECRRVKLVEYGGLGGRTAGGILGAAPAKGVCLAIGLNFGGRLACTIATASAGAYGGMQGGDGLGRRGGEFLFDVVTNNSGQGSE